MVMLPVVFCFSCYSWWWRSFFFGGGGGQGEG